MNTTKNPNDIQSLLNGIPEALKPTFEKVLSTIALQAEVIDDLMWKLEINEGANTMKKKIMGPALTQLAAKLDGPTIKGPTLEEISIAVTEMHEAIENATEAQNIFTTVLGFALKIAPLV
jgi:hypothetical protein